MGSRLAAGLDAMSGQATEQNWDFATMMGCRLADYWVAVITMGYPLDFCLVGMTDQATEQNWDLATMMGSRSAACLVSEIMMGYRSADYSGI